jgi:hypothetical protein
MKERMTSTRLRSLIFELVTALFAWYVTHWLYGYEMITTGILGLATTILVFRLFFMPVKHETWARYTDWFANRQPYPKNFQYVLVYFFVYLIFIIAIRQTTLTLIWLVERIIDTL